MISCDLIRILRKTLLFFFPFLSALLALARTSSSSCILVERCTVDLLFMKLITGRLDPQVINSVNNRPVNKSGILHGTLPSIMHRASALSPYRDFVGMLLNCPCDKHEVQLRTPLFPWPPRDTPST